MNENVCGHKCPCFKCLCFAVEAGVGMEERVAEMSTRVSSAVSFLSSLCVHKRLAD